MEELSAALDALAADDLAPLFAPALLDRLRGHARLSTSAAGQLVRTGRALHDLPVTAAAHAVGQVTAEQVAVAPVTRGEHLAAAAQGVDLGEVDAALAAVAHSQPYPRLRRVVHRYLPRLDPDGPDPTPPRAGR